MPEAPKLAWRRIVLGGLAISWRVIKGAARVAVLMVLTKARRDCIRGDFMGKGGTALTYVAESWVARNP